MLNNLDTFVSFIDFSKAYDRIPHNNLWCKLSKLGIHGKILSAIQSLYTGVTCHVRVNNCLSEVFDVKCGLFELTFNVQYVH